MKQIDWSADFETTTKANLEKDGYVRVWFWSLVSLDLSQEYYGTTIESFLSKVEELKCKKIWFFNLRFDGSFLVYHLTKTNSYPFDCLIDQMNIWYAVNISMPHGIVKIWDAYKKFPGMSVNDLAKLYKIEGKKERPDFFKYYPIDYKPTKKDIEYGLQDSRIVAFALSKEYEQGRKSITLSSDSFKEVQETIGGYNKWRKYMPKLSEETDAFCRLAYKGGITYVNPKYKGKTVKNVYCYDINSMYPWSMCETELPIGKPTLSFTEPGKDKLFIIQFETEFKLKEGFIPTVQVKDDPRYSLREFLTESKGITKLTLTSVDYELFKEHYEVYYEINKGYLVFDKMIGLLKPYIDQWHAIKEQATLDGDLATRFLAKRHLNSPYGKTGMKIERINKVPWMDENEELHYMDIPSKGDGIYVPYACFVCANARKLLVDSIQKQYDDFVYCDTDSIHSLCANPDIPIDNYELGKFKLEGKYEFGKYIRPKTYIHGRKVYGSNWYSYEIQEVKCAGMPDEVKGQVTYENFKQGTVFRGKKEQKRVKGGVVIMETVFEIKEE